MPLGPRPLTALTGSIAALLVAATPAIADWGPSTAISGSAMPTNGSIAIVPLPDADALTVFTDADTNDVVWQRFDSSSASWRNAPGVVAQGTSGPAHRTAGTALAAFVEGQATKVRAVWRSGPYDSASGNTILTSVFDEASNSWSPAEAVSAPGGAWGEAPEVAAGGGETYITWAETSTGGSLRVSRLGDDGATWTTTTLAPVGGLVRNVNVVVDGSGRATVAWTVDGSDFVWVSQRDPGDGASWSTPAHLAEPDTNIGLSDNYPRLVVDSDGVLTAAFTRIGRDGSNDVISRDIYATRYDPREQSPTWTSPVRVSRLGESSFEAQLGVDNAGTVTVAWDAAIGAIADAASGALAARFDPTGQSPAWTPAEVIAQGPVSRPLGVTPLGSATIVSWVGSGGVTAARRSAAGAWSAPVLVAPGQVPAAAATSATSVVFSYATGALTPWDASPGDAYAGAGGRYLIDSGSGPGVPEGVTASPDRNAIAVMYSPPADLGYWGAAKYRVTASPGPATCTSVTTTCTFTGLDAGQEYTFTVVAEGPGGASAASAPSNAVRPGGPTAPSGTKLWWGNWGYGFNGLSMSMASGTYGDTVVPGIPAWGLAADAARGRIYLLDLDTSTIKWVNADGTGQVQTLTTDNSPGEGLSFDATAGKLYWTTTTEAIAWGSVEDGAQGGVLYGAADPAVRAPRSVVVDPASNSIYWANATDGTVGYGDLRTAGNSGTITLSGCPVGLDPTSAIGVAVDPGADALYLAARTSSSAYALLKAQMNGSNCISLASGSAEILGLAVDTAANRAYVTRDSTLEYVDLNTPGMATVITTAALVDYPGFPMLFGAPTGTAQLSSSSAMPGATLTCAVDWAADAPGRSMYQAPRTTSLAWQRDGVTVAGSGTTLIADIPGTYRCVGTGANASGEASIRSGEVTIGSPSPSAPESSSASSPPSGDGSPAAPAVPTAGLLAPPAVDAAGDKRTRIVFRLRLAQSGRYTFILQHGAALTSRSSRAGRRTRASGQTGPRVDFLAGSTIGARVITKPSSAPVLKSGAAGQVVTVVALISGPPPPRLGLNVLVANGQAGLQGSVLPVR